MRAHLQRICVSARVSDERSSVDLDESVPIVRVLALSRAHVRRVNTCNTTAMLR